mgnify:CR=1 FL=1
MNTSLHSIKRSYSKHFKRVFQSNTKGFNEAELPEMLHWAHGRGMDLTVIETMPMGEIDADRTDQYLPLSLLRSGLERQFTIEDCLRRRLW